MLQEEGSSFLLSVCLVTLSAPLLLLPAVLAATSCFCLAAAVPSESLAMLLLELVLPVPLCSLRWGVLVPNVCAAPTVAVCAVLRELCCWVLQLGDQTNLMLGLHICCTPQALPLSCLPLLSRCDVGLEGFKCAGSPSTATAAAAAAVVTGSSTSCLHLGTAAHSNYNEHSVWKLLAEYEVGAGERNVS